MYKDTHLNAKKYYICIFPSITDNKNDNIVQKKQQLYNTRKFCTMGRTINEWSFFRLTS